MGRASVCFLRPLVWDEAAPVDADSEGATVEWSSTTHYDPAMQGGRQSAGSAITSADRLHSLTIMHSPARLPLPFPVSVPLRVCVAQEYAINEQVGSGAFGSVFKGYVRRWQHGAVQHDGRHAPFDSQSQEDRPLLAPRRLGACSRPPSHPTTLCLSVHCMHTVLVARTASRSRSRSSTWRSRRMTCRPSAARSPRSSPRRARSSSTTTDRRCLEPSWYAKGGGCSDMRLWACDASIPAQPDWIGGSLNSHPPFFLHPLSAPCPLSSFPLVDRDGVR